MFTTAIPDSTGIIQICNQALAHLGITNTITTLADGTPEADACSRYLPMSIDDALREHKYPFSTVEVALSVMPQTVLKWEFLYTYPAAALNIWNVYDEGTVDTKEFQEFEIINYGGTTLAIASNLEDAYAEYAYRVTDPTFYDAKFSKAVSYYLAASMAKTLTGDDNIGKELMVVYNTSSSETKRVSASEQVKKPPQESGYINARG